MSSSVTEASHARPRRRATFCAVCMIFLARLPVCLASQVAPFLLDEAGDAESCQKADAVVLATTTKVEWTKSLRRVSWHVMPGITGARWLKVHLEVEQVLSGPVEQRNITVQYWAADSYTNASSLNLPIIGERAIHYLAIRDGTYRYVTDLVHGKTRVFTGSHLADAGQTSHGSTVAAAARLLLSPGQEMNAALFARNLLTSVNKSLVLVGFAETFPMLSKLLAYPDPGVRANACIALYEAAFWGQSECLDSDRYDLTEPGLAAHIRELRSRRAAQDRQFAATFLANPIRTAKDYAVLPGDAGLADVLKFLSLHPDPTIARQSQASLRALAGNRGR